MFQTDRTPDVVQQNLRSSVVQVTRSAKALIDSGRRVESAIVVSNYDLQRFAEEKKKALASLNERSDFDVDVLDYAQTIEFLGKKDTASSMSRTSAK